MTKVIQVSVYSTYRADTVTGLESLGSGLPRCFALLFLNKRTQLREMNRYSTLITGGRLKKEGWLFICLYNFSQLVFGLLSWEYAINKFLSEINNHCHCIQGKMNLLITIKTNNSCKLFKATSPCWCRTYDLDLPI